ncbi:MAG: VOC family protein [Chitinophagales bacterium]
MSKNKIAPCIWLSADNGQLSSVMAYYQNVFGPNFQSQQIVPLGQTPSGYAEMCEVDLFGSRYTWMNTAQEHHPINDAVSLVIYCDNQNEIDHYWNYFTKEGKEAPCGWCIDRYGLRWQIIPRNLGQLMTKPNSQQIMMSQKKIIIDAFLK